jgi:hypothetical protein
MKFRVTSQTGFTTAVPDALRPMEHLNPANAVVTRDLRLKQSGLDGCGRATWEINGLGWQDITEYPRLGTTEIWRFINDSGVSHPMHMHLVMFQVLDRDGFTTGPGGVVIPNGTPQPPAAEERGWKDTAMVAPGQILRVIARFEDYKGKYAYHCHILEHEEHEMMRQFQTVACGDAILDPGEACDAGAANGAPGSCCTAACTPIADGAGCSDGNACTTNDQCAAGTCAGTQVGTPAEVTGAAFLGDGASLTWTPIANAPAGTVYDICRGPAGPWAVGSGGEACLATVSGPPAMDPGAPSPGQAFWYLIRGRNACGTGTYGFAATHGMPTSERITSACP